MTREHFLELIAGLDDRLSNGDEPNFLANCVADIYEEACVDQRNIGSDITADKLLEITRTGKHTGVFGGAKQEECARAILRIRNDERERCAVIAENWGNAPPNPNGRRAALAAAIRSGASVEQGL